ncbi:lytic transglycosylase domain-containing protein [Snodgrassella sp. CFCC 13594]|uniref:lytic transglycosylase domain-containing protein n=1 Tax=Snodgrassella sp. CFCC 13594 TaxID=1775559 RepID=UPI000829D935|nr:lytic transglycosylase domain-containing protein [Snodgrassella sp. CFCC 13594]
MLKNAPRLTHTLIASAVLLLAACSSQQETPVEPIGHSNGGILPGTQKPEAPNEVVSNYQWYQTVLIAIKANDDAQPAQFLARQNPSAMANTVRNQWLKSLGKRGNWTLFRQQYAQLNAADRDQETRCYAAFGGIDSDRILRQELVRELGRLPEGCNRWLNQAAAAGQLNSDDAWRRVRGLLAANQITDARNLAQSLGSPLSNPLNSSTGGSAGAQESLLYRVISKEGRSQSNAAATLQGITPNLTPPQVGFAWAQLGLTQAYNQNASNALAYFDQADINQMSVEMWEWYARSALRLQRWEKLADIIRAMPKKLQDDPTWQYWLARSYVAQGKNEQAKSLFQHAATSGRNFYALLATEALGNKADVRSNAGESSRHDLKKVEQDGNINRSLVLFNASQNGGDWTMRRQAQQEWRYAIRDYNEDTLLASSALAEKQGFYEMGILSADKTNHKLNYALRYIAPFKNLTVPYAQQAGVDPAWVYGLIRQESRFMIGAKSNVGATGLMQVMPATANEIANKLGMSPDELHTMAGNIRMGTWYLGDIRTRLGDEVLATAGYNAGPSRARRWQAAAPLEGAIYAETIPFDETRTYVKNVMTNATYYANLFNEPQTSLTKRMGMIPAR